MQAHASGDAAVEWIDRLLMLGRSVRQTLIAARDRGEDMATSVAHEGGDTIFAIDRRVEPTIERHISDAAASLGAIELVAEGMGDDGRQQIGNGPIQWRVIVDPIDGTRNIMYDKRSAWFIAAAVPGIGATLRDAVASVMVELPTSKAGWADEFAATVGETVRGRRVSLDGKIAKPQACEPSRAVTLMNGFGQVSNFFPGTKRLASELMEQIVQATLGEVEPGSAAVFDDQYITTAGQWVELMLGHDRFCCDLRPLFYRAVAQRTGRIIRGLECHPYDMAGMLVAQQAGIILTDGFGRELNAPLDVHSGVHWCGYANASLRQAIEPVIQRFLRSEGIALP